MIAKRQPPKKPSVPADSISKFAVATLQYDRHGNAIHDRRLSRYFGTSDEAWIEASQPKYNDYDSIHVIEIIRHTEAFE